MKCSFSTNSAMGSIVLVISITIFTMLVMVDPVQSCHRKVEYHHYYKKHPVKGHGWGWPGWNSYGQSHNNGWKKGNGWNKGWDKGHDNYGHKGYGWEPPKGHKGYSGGGHEKGYGHDMGGHEKGYGHTGGHEKGYGHTGGHEKGYGHDMGGHKGYGHDMGGHEKGYGHTGGHEKGYGHEQKGGYEDYGHMPSYTPKHKGMKYKHSSYEMTTYGDKGGGGHSGGHNSHGGYDNSNHKGHEYGMSGPYPNTEYSSPVVVTSYEPSSEIGGSDDTSLSIGAVDAADYIRALNSGSDTSHNGDTYVSSPIIEDAVPLSSSDSGSSHENLRTRNNNPNRNNGDISSGNFDLNLEFNGELPGPFRRTETKDIIRSPRKRKKISSTFKAESLGTSI